MNIKRLSLSITLLTTLLLSGCGDTPKTLFETKDDTTFSFKVSETQSGFEWQPIQGIDYYEIERARTTSPTDFVFVSSITTTQFQPNFNGLLYHYRIRGCSLNSNIGCLNWVTWQNNFLTSLNLSGNQLSWSAAAGVTHYELERATNPNGVFAHFQSHSTHTTYVALASQTYHYRVRACANTICTAPSASVAVVPVAVANFSLNNNNLSWDTITNATHYQIERAINGSDSFQIVSTQTTIAFVPDRIISITYDYRIRGCANECSLPSDVITIAPVTVTGFTQNMNTLNWDTVAGASRYEIERAISGTSNFQGISTLTSAAGFTFDRITTTTYDYRIRACASECTSYSNSITVAPVTVTNLSLSGNTLNWDTVAGASRYEIERAISGTSNFQGISTLTSAAGFSLDRITTTTYDYRIRACANQCTSYSSVTVAPVTIANFAQNNNTLQWDALTGASHYQIERAISGSSNFQVLTTQTNTAYVALSSQTYTYQVRACAKECTPLSNQITVAPVTIANFAQNNNTLQWNALTGASHYQIERAINGTSNFQGVSTLTSAAGFSLDRITTTTYDYRIRACASECTSYSNSITVAPVTVTNLSLSGNTLNWDTVAGASRYEIGRAISGTSNFQGVSTLTSAAGFSLDRITTTTYDYRIRACAGQCTSYSSVTVAPVTIANFAQNNNILQWDALTGASHYQIERAISGTNNFQSVSTKTSAAGFTLDRITTTTYTYRIRACAGQCTSYSSVTVAPVTIANFAQNNNTLQWDALTGASHYQIERAISGSSNFQVLTTQTNTAYVALSSQTYTYQVRACAKECTLPSNQITVAPFTISNFSQDNNTLRWDTVAGASHYQIERAISGSSNFQVLTTQTNTAYVARSSQTYTYQVRACAKECTLPSNQITAAPFAISNFSQDNNTLRWDTVAGASHYQIERAISGSSNFQVLTTQTNTAYVALSSQTYTYQVRGCAKECTLPSNQITVAPVTIANFAQNNNTLQWDALTGASHYQIERAISGSSNFQVLTTQTNTAYVALSSQTYTYQVRACAEECSLPSASVTVALVAVANLSLSGNTLNWDTLAGAHYYQIERATVVAATNATTRRPELDFDILDAAGNRTPIGMWSDGTTMWVADTDDDKLYAYNLSTKARDAAKDFDTLSAAGNNGPSGMWSDGTTMWVADTDDDKLYAYNLSTKARDAAKDFDTLSAAGNNGPSGMWSDGTTMWLADSSDEKIYAYNVATKARDSSKDFYTLSSAGNNNPYSIWSDGTTMWVADLNDHKIYAYNLATKVRDSSKDFDTLSSAGNNKPYSIWSDGITLWVTDGIDNKLYAYQSFLTPTTYTVVSTQTTTSFNSERFTSQTIAYRIRACATECSIPNNPRLVNLAPTIRFSTDQLSWNAVTSADHYQLERAVLGSSTYTLVTNLTTTTFAPDRFTTITYNYRVRACTDNCTPPSDPIIIFPVTVANLSLSGNTLSWDALAGAHYYQIESAIVVASTNATTRRPELDFDIIDAAGNNNPSGMWSDGTTMWVADTDDDKLYAYNLSTKARDAAKDFDTLSAAGNNGPSGMWSDGTTMWVADTDDDKLYAYNLSTKARDAAKDFDTLSAAGNNGPSGMWSDGTTMWVADWDDNEIYTYNLATKERDSSKDFDTLISAGNGSPYGIWSDGTTMWVADWDDNKIYAYNLATKARDSSKDFDTLSSAGNNKLDSIWSDGTTMWVTDYSDDKIYAYQSFLTPSDYSVVSTQTATNFTLDAFTSQTVAYRIRACATECSIPNNPRLVNLAPTIRFSTDQLSWNAVTSADHYQLERAVLGSSTYTLVTNLTTTTFAPDRFTTITYNYRVRACTDNCTPPSDPIIISPVTVANLSLSGNTLSWDALAGAHYYQIESAIVVASTNATTRRPELDFDILDAAGNDEPLGIWSDGTTMWVMVAENRAIKLHAYNLATKEREPTKDFNTLSAAGNDASRGMWSDGITIWVADIYEDKLYAYNLSTKARDAAKDFDTLSAAGNKGPGDIWSDGTTMWVADYSNDKIYAYNLATKARDSSKDFNTLSSAGNNDPIGIWSDGTTMWVTDWDDNKIYAYNLATKVRDGSKDFDTLSSAGNNNPRGIWSDGITIWVADRSDKLFAYQSFLTPSIDTVVTIQTTTRLTLEPFTSQTVAYRIRACATECTIPTNPRLVNLAPTIRFSNAQLSWNTVEGANHYQLERAVAGSSTYTLVTDLTTSTFAPDFTSITYIYSVRACLDDRCTSLGNQAWVDPTPQVDVSNNQLSWDPVAGASHYQIERAILGSNTYTLLTSQTATHFAPDRFTTITYHYRMRACTDNCTPPSDSITIFPVTVADLSLSGNTLSWDALAGAHYYRIESAIVVASTNATTRLAELDFDTLNAAGNNNPGGIWSDGTTMWVADYSDDKIYAYNLATKVRDSNKDFDTLDSAGNGYPSGIWSDGTTMWVADDWDNKLYAYNLATKARDSNKDFDTLSSAGNGYPSGIWSDGTTMWVADLSDDKIYAYNLATKARDSSKDFDTLSSAGNNNPEGIWSDGTTMWVTDYSDDKIYAYNLATKVRDSSKDFDTLSAAGNNNPEGIWSDGTTMWVTDNSDDKIYAYQSFLTASDYTVVGTQTGTSYALGTTSQDHAYRIRPCAEECSIVGSPLIVEAGGSASGASVTASAASVGSAVSENTERLAAAAQVVQDAQPLQSIASTEAFIQAFTAISGQGEEQGRYQLVADLDFSAQSFTQPLISTFSGTLDGGGHVIRNVSLSSTAQRMALFQAVTGSIDNLQLDTVQVQGSRQAAVLTNALYGSLSRIAIRHATVEATADSTATSGSAALFATVMGSSASISNSYARASTLSATTVGTFNAQVHAPSADQIENNRIDTANAAAALPSIRHSYAADIHFRSCNVGYPLAIGAQLTQTLLVEPSTAEHSCTLSAPPAHVFRFNRAGLRQLRVEQIGWDSSVWQFTPDSTYPQLR